jgi:hypothetical protein
LFVGTTESLLKLTSDFDLQELGQAFVYSKISPPATPAPHS